MFVNISATKYTSEYINNMLAQEDSEEGIESLQNNFNYIQNCFQPSHLEGFMYASLNADRNVNASLFKLIEGKYYGSIDVDIKQSEVNRSRQLQKVCYAGMYTGPLDMSSEESVREFQIECRKARKSFRLQIYGIADNIEQIKKLYEKVLDKSKDYVCLATPIVKGENGGWRWHKWGPYIGTQKPTAEYLDEEELINQVFVYHIHEVQKVTDLVQIEGFNILYTNHLKKSGTIYNEKNEIVARFGIINLGVNRGKFFIGQHSYPLFITDECIDEKVTDVNELFTTELRKLKLAGKL